MLIRLEQFSGLIPKLSNRQLPNNAASLSENVQLYSGELRGLDTPQTVADLTAEVFTIRRAYRLFDGATSIADTPGTWIPFDDSDVNFIRGALTNDQFDRYYASGGTLEPSVNSAAGWQATKTGLDLGVPAPTVAPTVTPPASGTVDESRAYVYTFINIWGEESAPSPPSTTVTGDITGTFNLSGMQIAYPIAGTHAPIDKIRIYRTITGLTTVDYRFVAELDPPAATYADAVASDDVALNEALESQSYELPPAGLQGIVNMANGIMVGFVGRDLYFSEPYRPHAWPREYVLSVDSEIVGLGAYQSGVVVCTTANPYVATGSNPFSITLTRIDDVEPCVSFRSIITGLNGVTFASANGMILVNQQGATNITESIITRNEWRDEYLPYTIEGASDGGRTVAFNTTSSGFLFQPNEPLGYITKISGFVDVEAVQTDPFTGEVYIVARDTVQLWNPTTTQPLAYEWRSKVFETPYPVNMGGFRLQYEDVITGGDFEVPFDFTNYNTSRITTPTDPLNGAPINGVLLRTGVTESPPVIQWRNPIGGSPIYPTSPVQIRDSVQVTVWADGTVIYQAEITSQDAQRLPSGFKADKWQVGFSTAQNIYSFNLATTLLELRQA